MHRSSLLAVALAVGLVASVALAANDKVSVTFSPLAASSVAGKADLNPIPQGGTMVHGSLRGLQPGVEYISVAYQQSATCGAGGPTTEIARFVANPAGIATFNRKVALDLPQFSSISVQLASDNVVQACAAVTP